ncbi:MAG: pentapeptide repeat-containing protein [Anaerolineales bacterium]|nr:pentapeptide repeat-containing protein [Anaerolineales bacterium]
MNQTIQWTKRNFISIVGFILAAAAFLMGLFGYINQHATIMVNNQEVELYQDSPFLGDFYANISAELASIAITILIIDAINQRRNKQQELDDLKWQMGSKDNVLVLEAVRKLRGKKWLIDGTLHGIDLRGANLSSAKLFMADLEGANLEKVKLNGAFLKMANLRNANVTVEQLATAGNLEKAIMPDGRKYEEWEPIIQETPPAETVTTQLALPENNQHSKILLLLAGAGIAVVSSVFSLWARGRWDKG